MKPAKTKLQLVHPAARPERIEIEFEARLRGDRLEAVFDVRAPALHANPQLGRDASQWGLWDWDVVELFLATEPGPAARYFEFQVSPLGQFFELEIFEPRKRFNRDFRSGFGHGVELQADGWGDEHWQARMSIPLKTLGWRGNPADLRGNAFAILGEPSARTYWSLFLEPQQTPDFHLPDRFRPLLKT
jgi:hypothetical protein